MRRPDLAIEEGIGRFRQPVRIGSRVFLLGNGSENTRHLKDCRSRKLMIEWGINPGTEKQRATNRISDENGADGMKRNKNRGCGMENLAMGKRIRIGASTMMWAWMWTGIILLAFGLFASHASGG